MKIDLSIDPVTVINSLTKFIRSEIARSGLSRAVVNLSGGLDSSVSCILAVRALGPENVLGLRLPYKTSSPGSLEHARMIIELTGIRTLTIPITDMADPLINLDPGISPIRKGNIMARMRMIVAYDQSAAFKGLVVGTGNKTEILLGYTTLYGDSACAFNPLGDLYKTQVRQLARVLAVPEPIIAKPPSADLWSGQTDEDELGFTYDQVDQLLFLLVEKRYRPEDCLQAGFEEVFVRKVLSRVRANKFKSTLPPVASLTERTPGVDSLDLLDWEK